MSEMKICPALNVDRLRSRADLALLTDYKSKAHQTTNDCRANFQTIYFFAAPSISTKEATEGMSASLYCDIGGKEGVLVGPNLLECEAVASQLGNADTSLRLSSTATTTPHEQTRWDQKRERMLTHGLTSAARPERIEVQSCSSGAATTRSIVYAARSLQICWGERSSIPLLARNCEIPWGRICSIVSNVRH